MDNHQNWEEGSLHSCGERVPQTYARQMRKSLSTWIEYGFKHTKNELGWADFRVTNYPSIERWWELISSVYLLVSLQSPVLQHADDTSEHSYTIDPSGTIAKIEVAACRRHI